ncbi:proprotein convertase P-domain-containing protein [Labedaea rhizosphaerae]|uniref:Streptogrisin C n=1 Tax=Labedaea rhizosphaerae TaxID=598644 RepID=A0A4V3CZG4_LABRH|nr:proprotein convertase P-domain-containing protein [Labedaea rhizosphaerae]TDP97898.1 streptogrisin C [Labedaea rhizosphaerae]
MRQFAAASGLALLAAIVFVPTADATPVPDLAASQQQAHGLAASLPAGLKDQLAGEWFDAKTRRLTVAVTTASAARQAEAAGAVPVVVRHSRQQLEKTTQQVRALVGHGVPGVFGWGTDVRANEVTVSVDDARATKATADFEAKATALGVRVVHTKSMPHQQSGTISTGNPWWPGGESNCSVGFPVTDASGAKQFLTAGHCTNDVNQPAYGASGQQNRIGTSNVGGSHSVNGSEGDMGVVAATEPGWTLSPSVNTWGQPAVTVSGAEEAMVGDTVCHSGNTSHWQCGEVKYTHRAVDYGGGLVIEDLTWTTACSLGGDSGGGWLLGDKATGLHDGGPSQCVDNPSDGDMSLFQPVIEALTKWNLTLVTGGGGSTDTTPPSAPANVRVTATTSSSVSLSWDASTDDVGVTGYEVSPGGAVTGTSTTVTGLTPDTAYSFTVKARDAAGNRSAASTPVTARTQPGSTGRTFTSNAHYAIADYKTVTSPVSVTLSGPAASTVTVTASIQHTCAEDLDVQLVSPSGWWYPLKSSGGSTCTAWSGTKTFAVQGVSAQAQGTWKLRIADWGAGDTGTLNGWSLTL